MKTSYQKIFYPLIILLLVVAVAPAYAYPDFHEAHDGWKYGPHGKGAYSYVSGWWWGTDYCDPFTFVHGWSPSDAYHTTAHWGQCGYNTAWTRTDVYWQDQYGQYHLDVEAFAAI